MHTVGNFKRQSFIAEEHCYKIKEKRGLTRVPERVENPRTITGTVVVFDSRPTRHLRGRRNNTHGRRLTFAIYANAAADGIFDAGLRCH